jgi:hypothetical protein
VGAPVLIVFLLFIVFVSGGLLIRGQGAVRGPRFWIGMTFMLGGAAAFLYIWFRAMYLPF